MKKLEDRFKIRELSVHNRLVLAPLTTNYASESGRITAQNLRFYKARSRQMGIVIVEAAAVSPEGRIIPGGIGLWEDGQIEGMAELVRVIKAEGAGAVIQINHAGAKAWPFETIDAWVAPSDIACRPGITAKPASLDEIKGIIQAFTDASVRAKKAGFDGVEIHGAHLYLLSQFLSPLTNRRTDRYGGGIEGRAALAIEITRAVREKLGPDHPIFFRLNVLENMDGGMTPDEAVVIGKLLAGAGVDVLDLSLAVQGTWKEDAGRTILVTTSAYAKDETPGDVVNLAARFRDECGLPVIAVGRLGTKLAARKALEAGADLVAIGRQMICDPDTARKILSGGDDQILECECCQTCFACLGMGKPVKCKHNRNLPD
jgi:2,4-dienoyl-CoA reductase-like NADH-dependent reductase (Old Yellow Enzyme family)